MTFQPDWICSPGESIANLARGRGWSHSQLRKALQVSDEELNSVLSAKVVIDVDFAQKLSNVIGGATDFWLRREQIYRHRLHGNALAEAEAWAKSIDFAELARLGWVDATLAKKDKLIAALSLFGIGSYDEFLETYKSTEKNVAFRIGRGDVSNLSTLAWLRQGERQARNANLSDWDRGKFHESLFLARDLTREKDPRTFLSKLQRLCASCGVALVVLPAPKGCAASGATYFLNRCTPVLQMSFRYKTDDQFWFTFFHEAAHLLKHDASLLFLEGEGLIATPEEREANEFASDFLVPHHVRHLYHDLARDYKKVLKLAFALKVSPGIIVGQMQHAGVIPHAKMQFLKRRYDWNAAEGFTIRERR